MPNNAPTDNFIFFGSSRLSLIVLDELLKRGIKPAAIVTTPDKPKGRKLILTPPEVKTFGDEQGIPVFQFAKLNAEAVDALRTFMTKISGLDANTASGGAIRYFLVASYGLIIPQPVLDLMPNRILNIHPSMLPEYRGATPIQQALIDDRSDTGVSIMQIDAQMDHGPVFLQEKRNDAKADKISAGARTWPKRYADLEEGLARQGARMIADNIVGILDGSIMPQEQDHDTATFTKKIEKADGEISIAEDALKGAAGRKAFLKFNAYYEWPSTYFFIKNKTATNTDENANDAKPIRVKITDAEWDANAHDGTGEMRILKVIPEGQKETLWSEYKKKFE